MGRQARSGARPAHPNMFDAAVDGTFKGLYVQGEDILQSDPDTKHVSAGLARWNSWSCRISSWWRRPLRPCLPAGRDFLEKDGTFTNAERRIQRVTKVMSPKNGYGDWEITQLIANAMGWAGNTRIPSEIMDEIARLTPSFKGVSFEKLEEEGSSNGLAMMKIRMACQSCTSTDSRAARASSSSRICAHRRAHGPRFPLLLTTGAYCRSTMWARRRGAPRTASGIPRMCSKSTRTTPSFAASRMAIGKGPEPRGRSLATRANHRSRLRRTRGFARAALDPLPIAILTAASSASCGWISSTSSGCPLAVSVRRVCAPHCTATIWRPVVSSTGNASVRSSVAHIP